MVKQTAAIFNPNALIFSKQAGMKRANSFLSYIPIYVQLGIFVFLE